MRLRNRKHRQKGAEPFFLFQPPCVCVGGSLSLHLHLPQHPLLKAPNKLENCLQSLKSPSSYWKEEEGGAYLKVSELTNWHPQKYTRQFPSGSQTVVQEGEFSGVFFLDLPRRVFILSL